MENVLTLPAANFFKNVRIKVKLLVVLGTLILLNTIYFHFSVSAISEMNTVVLQLYDKVLMAGTYSRSAKFDFARYSEFIQSAILAENSRIYEDAIKGANENINLLSDDLDVVSERALTPDEVKVVEDIKSKIHQIENKKEKILGRLKSESKNKTKDQIGLKLELQKFWLADESRNYIFQSLTDLSDKVVADGYEFRLRSDERNKFIKKASYIFSGTVFFANFLGIGFILISILPQLRMLTNTCREIGAGGFNKRITLTSKDEFGELAHAFNYMLEIINEKELRLVEELRTTSAMVNSLGQGFLMFNSDGVCLPTYSKACQELLETVPASKRIWEVLKVSKEKTTDFQKWSSLLFEDILEFDEAALLGESTFHHSQGKDITLEYRPVRDENNAIVNVVVVATDKTEELQAKLRAAREKAFSGMILKIIQNRDQFGIFLNEAKNTISALHLEESNIQAVKASLPNMLRNLHTLKGASATYMVASLKDAAHECEEQIAKVSSLESEDSEKLFKTLNECHRHLDGIYNKFVNENLALLGLKFDENQSFREIPTKKISEFFKELRLESDHQRLVDKFVSTFMTEPIQNSFEVFNSTIEEIATRQGKQVAPIKITGGEIPVVAENYQELFSSLVHAFRNAVDHGLEAVEERILNGKNPVGTINVRISREKAGNSRWLVLEIDDDGRGINPDLIRKKLLTQESPKTSEKNFTEKSDFEVIQMIFESGVSTRDQVTDISGRGVGLNAVKAAAVDLGGSAFVESQVGRGTTIFIRIPELIEPHFSSITRDESA